MPPKARKPIQSGRDWLQYHEKHFSVFNATPGSPSLSPVSSAFSLPSTGASKRKRESQGQNTFSAQYRVTLDSPQMSPEMSSQTVPEMPLQMPLQMPLHRAAHTVTEAFTQTCAPNKFSNEKTNFVFPKFYVTAPEIIDYGSKFEIQVWAAPAGTDVDKLNPTTSPYASPAHRQIIGTRNGIPLCPGFDQVQTTLHLNSDIFTAENPVDHFCWDNSSHSSQEFSHTDHVVEALPGKTNEQYKGPHRATVRLKPDCSNDYGVEYNISFYLCVDYEDRRKKLRWRKDRLNGKLLAEAEGKIEEFYT